MNEQSDIVAQALNAAVNTDEPYRARRLVELAPLLSPPLLQQALGAATAIADDFSRTEALTGLAPFLPVDLLPQALAATPKESSEAFIAILGRCRSVLAGAGDAIYVNLLRDSLSGTDRRICLEIITAVTPALAEIGGVRAIEECVSAIFDVTRWWR